MYLNTIPIWYSFDKFKLFQELAKLLEDQHGYIDLQNIPEDKYYSMTQAENEEEKIWLNKT